MRTYAHSTNFLGSPLPHPAALAPLPGAEDAEYPLGAPCYRGYTHQGHLLSLQVKPSSWAVPAAPPEEDAGDEMTVIQGEH